MTDVIIVQPAAELRVEFARWGLYYQPAFRTVSTFEFAVPADAFTEAPEELLVGSIVDGHPYRPIPVEEREQATREAVPGAPLPELPESVYGPDSAPVDPPEAVDAPAAAGEQTGDAEPAPDAEAPASPPKPAPRGRRRSTRKEP